MAETPDGAALEVATLLQELYLTSAPFDGATVDLPSLLLPISADRSSSVEQDGSLRLPTTTGVGMSEVTVRKATAADVPQVARTLGRAFNDDPAFAWGVPDARRRERYGDQYFTRVIEKIYLPKDEVYLTEDGLAAAVWAPPDRWETPTSAALALLPVMLKACRTKIPRALKMVSLMESTHKESTEPHYYLPFIGAEPAGRGHGRGTALLRSMLERCDTEGRPAYLESTSIQNQALYHRHGFEVLEELHWPDGGPPFWPMWRRPR